MSGLDGNEFREEKGKCGKLNVKEVLRTNTSTFRHMAIYGIGMTIGSVAATVVDLVWLIGDMLIIAHTHHWIILAGLIVATLIMVLSAIWFIKALRTYAEHHDKAINSKKRTKIKISKHTHAILTLRTELDKVTKDLVELQQKLEAQNNEEN